jgi:hypothetical protein
MIGRGAQILVQPHDDGTASLLCAFSEDAEYLAALRAACWGIDEPPKHPPPPGSEERGEVLVLCRFVTSILASVPTG